MALKPIPYRNLGMLLRGNLSKSEDQKTLRLMEQLRPARGRGYLTPRELEAVCLWKSARAIQHIRANSARRIRSATRQALATRSERNRLAALRSLKGVSVPMASAILTLLNPRRYGVVDIRVWQMLYKLGTVTQKPSGVGFTFKNWSRFLMVLRYFSRTLKVNARDVERTLFAVHREYQKGRLYRLVNRRPSNSTLQRPGLAVLAPAAERAR